MSTDPKIVELREAFADWCESHGHVWFDDDIRLAKAIGTVIGVEIKFPGYIAPTTEETAS